MNVASSHQPRQRSGNPRFLFAWCIARWMTMLLAGACLSVASAMVCSYMPVEVDEDDLLEYRSFRRVRSAGVGVVQHQWTPIGPFESRLPRLDAMPQWSGLLEFQKLNVNLIDERSCGWPYRCLYGAMGTGTSQQFSIDRYCTHTSGAIVGRVPDALVEYGVPKGITLVPRNVHWNGMIRNTLFYAFIVAMPMLFFRWLNDNRMANRRRFLHCQRCNHLHAPNHRIQPCLECQFPRTTIWRTRGRRWVLYGVSVAVLVSIPVGIYIIQVSNAPWSTPLSMAAATGDVAAIRQLVADGHDVHQLVYPEEITPLEIAKNNWNVDAVRVLTELSAPVENAAEMAKQLTAAAAHSRFGPPGSELALAETEALLALGADPLFTDAEVVQPVVSVLPSVSLPVLKALVAHSDSLCNIPSGTLAYMVMTLSMRNDDEKIHRFFEGEYVPGLGQLSCIDDTYATQLLHETLVDITNTGAGSSSGLVQRSIRLARRGFPVAKSPDNLAQTFRALGVSKALMQAAVEGGFDPFSVTADGQNWWFFMGDEDSTFWSNYRGDIDRWHYLIEIDVDPNQPDISGTVPIDVIEDDNLLEFLSQYVK